MERTTTYMYTEQCCNTTAQLQQQLLGQLVNSQQTHGNANATQTACTTHAQLCQGYPSDTRCCGTNSGTKARAIPVFTFWRTGSG